MGQPFKYAITALVLFAACVDADEIRIGGKLHRDVYVRTSKQFYYVHYPEEGRVEKLSKKRRDVGDVSIDSDEVKREKWLTQFNERKAEMAATSSAGLVEPKSVDSAQYKLGKRLVDSAVFEAQLMHWEKLSPQQQDLIFQDVSIRASQNEAEKAAALGEIQRNLGRLESEKAERQFKIAIAEGQRERAVEDAVEGSNAEYYEKEKYAHIRRNQLTDSSYQSEFGQYLDERTVNYYGAAEEAERIVEQRKIDAANEAYEAEASRHISRLKTVESAISKKERDALATQSKVYDANMRYAAFLSRINELILASRQNYKPGLEMRSIVSWEGREGQRTEPFEIKEGVWRLDCDYHGANGAGFSVMIHDAETGRPFTRIADMDFLRMRMRVFDEPGRYYLVVEGDSEARPYKITVSVLSQER